MDSPKTCSSGGSPASCDAGIFLLDDEPIFWSGSRETRTHKSVGARPPVFKTGSSSGRMTSVLDKLRELESNQRPPGSEPGVTTNYPASFLFQRHTVLRMGSLSCGGSNLRTRVRSHVFTDLHQRVPCESRGSRTRLARLEAWSLCRSAKDTRVVKRKERESNPQGSSLDRFRGGCRRQSACPSVC